MPTIQYKLKDGSRVSGTTTIIGSNLGWSKDALMYWSWKQGCEGKDFRETKQSAADSGTLAHAFIEQDILSVSGHLVKPVILSEYTEEQQQKARKCFENFAHWKETVGFKPIKTELHIVSELYQFGGTLDCIAEVNGKVALFDWKTSNSVHEDYLIQLAAYQKCYEENFPDEKLNGAYLLRINKEDASWVFYFWEDLSFAWEVFLNLLSLHNAKKLFKGKT